MAAGYSLDELARRIGGTVRGDGTKRIRGVATLDRATADELGFLTNPKYRVAARTSRAGAILVAPGSGLGGRDLLEVDEPYLALARLLELYHPAVAPPPGVSELACVGRDVRLGAGVAVGPFAVVEDGVVLGPRAVVGAGCVVGRGSTVGRESELKPRVVLYPGTRIGARCLVHSGVVLGADGFGFATSSGRHHKIPQVGRVVIEDDVEIGANTTIDRGSLEDTRIGEGTKIDDQVMIAHGVDVGRDCLFAAQSGVAGSTRIGASCTFAGQSGAAGHLRIADGTVVAAKSAVLGDVSTAGLLAGVPATEHGRWKRAQALFRRLPELHRQLRDLEARVERLELPGREEEADG